MYLGKLCEVAPSDDLYHHPMHHYTRVLLDSIPVPDPAVAVRKTAIEGEIPSPVAPPPGCRFNTRCPAAQDICRMDEPQLREMAPGHFVACHFPAEVPVTVRATA
jgi:peptide/nickel transport system ATP-binding protein